MLDLSKLYHLPWTKYNSPNGWIEVTTYCQLKCPGCYRECNNGNISKHRDLEEIKKEIDAFIKERKVQFISFAGGEPLMYPWINEALNYTKSKGIGARIITNGILLNKEKIIELKEAGMTECNAHLDKHMGRLNINSLRKQMCDMFREVDNISFGFITTVANETRNDFIDLINICKKNSDVVDSLVVTTYGNIFKDTISPLTRPDTSELIEFLRKEFGGLPCAYLTKTINKDKPGWLFTYTVFKNGKIVRTFSGEDYSKFWERMYIEGRISDSNKNILDDGTKFLTIQLIIAPTKINGKWDVCEGFPDGMYYKGDIITSCLLEVIKKEETKKC